MPEAPLSTPRGDDLAWGESSPAPPRAGLGLLVRKGFRCLANMRRVVVHQSVFRLGFSVSFMAVTMVCLFGVFYAGFDFLDETGGVGVFVIHRLFALFFFGLGALLLLSSAITAYTTYYQSREMAYLVLRPLPRKEIISYKYIETTFMSSWAFFFIIAPFVGAYTAYEKLSLLFTFWTLLFCLPFAMICCALGTLVTIVLVRFLPRGKPLVLGMVVVLGWVGIVAMRSVHGVLQDTGNDHVLLINKLIPGFKFTSHPLWPSYWVAEGMMSMSRGRWTRGLQFFGLLVSWVVVLQIAVRQFGAWLFYDGWQRVLTSATRVSGKAVILRPLEGVLHVFMPTDFRALFMKDLRTFLRDPAQWTQGLIFYGILALYFVNLRNLQYDTLSPQWRNVIAFLNVFSVSAVMCSLGARFIFPQLSLEGQGFWIIGMSPVTMRRVLVSKFTTSLCVLATISVLLMLLSVRMLNANGPTRVAAMSIAAAMSATVAGMSTGLGAVFIDLKQRNPAAIISSFGGTLNLVLSLVYMFGVIIPFAAIFHVHTQSDHLGPDALQAALLAAYGYLLIVTAAATTLPLWLGARSLGRREY